MRPVRARKPVDDPRFVRDDDLPEQRLHPPILRPALAGPLHTGGHPDLALWRKPGMRKGIGIGRCQEQRQKAEPKQGRPPLPAQDEGQAQGEGDAEGQQPQPAAGPARAHKDAHAKAGSDTDQRALDMEGPGIHRLRRRPAKAMLLSGKTARAS